MDPEGVKLFYEKEFQPLWEETAERLEEEFQKRKEEKRQEFCDTFRNTCQKIQECGRGAAYLHYDLLRTRIAVRRYAYPATLYGRGWYLDGGERMGELDVGFFYQYLEEVWDEVQKRRWKYAQKVSWAAAEQLVAGKIGHIHAYVVEWMRYSIGRAVESEEYKGVEKEEEFEIETGELYEPGSLVYQEWRGKDKEGLKKWLEGREGVYYFSDFRGMNLAGMDGAGMDLSYADFSESQLAGSTLTGSILVGARFRRSRMEGASICGCLLSDADMEAADLRGADFRGSVAAYGKAIGGKAGYAGASFAESRLEGADFRNTILTGVDFRGAELEGAKFSGSILSRSRFEKRQLEQCQFEKRQIEEMKVDE